jgi:hypothetical protein
MKTFVYFNVKSQKVIFTCICTDILDADKAYLASIGEEKNKGYFFKNSWIVVSIHAE